MFIRKPGKYRTKIHLFALTILVSGYASGIVNGQIQDASLNKIEKVYVHLARNTLVSGEVLPFKAYLFSGATNEEQSKILYFSLINGSGDEVAHWRTNIRNRASSGNYRLPDSISTGIYILHAYTMWMLNRGPLFAHQQPLLVVNLAEESPTYLNKTVYAGNYQPDIDTVRKKTRIYAKEDGLKIELQGLEKAMKINTDVHVKIKLNNLKPGEKVDFSCSVQEVGKLTQDYTKPSIGKYIAHFSDTKANEWLCSSNSKRYAAAWDDESSCHYPIENQRFLFTGKVINQTTGLPLKNKQLLLAYENDQPTLNYTVTNHTGDFYFWLDTVYDNKKLVVQVKDRWNANDRLSWKINTTTVRNRLLQNQREFLTDEQIAYIKQVARLGLIHQIYFSDTTENKPDTASSVDSVPLLQPDYTVLPAEYDLLDNFFDITDNIMPVVSLKNKKGIWQFNVYDWQNQIRLDGNATVFLNGVPFYNLDYLANMPWENIDRINVIPQNIFFGLINFQGIVTITTFDKKVPGSYLTHNAVIYKNTVLPESDQTVVHPHDATERLPYFLPLLYWDPYMKAGSEGASVSFTTSGYRGNYIFEIEGVSNLGRTVSARYKFNVE